MCIESIILLEMKKKDVQKRPGLWFLTLFKKKDYKYEYTISSTFITCHKKRLYLSKNDYI
jgi:hypothetical protein